jgi:hypothetical protein
MYRKRPFYLTENQTLLRIPNLTPWIRYPDPGFKKSGTGIRDRHIISKELFVDSLLRIKIRYLVAQCLIRDRHPRSETREYF